LLTKDLQQPNVNTPEMRESLEWFESFFKEELAAPGWSSQGGQSYNWLFNEQIGAYVGPAGLGDTLPYFETRAGDMDWDWTYTPTSRVPRHQVSGWGVAMTKDAPNPEAAW